MLFQPVWFHDDCAVIDCTISDTLKLCFDREVIYFGVCDIRQGEKLITCHLGTNKSAVLGMSIIRTYEMVF